MFTSSYPTKNIARLLFEKKIIQNTCVIFSSQIIATMCHLIHKTVTFYDMNSFEFKLYKERNQTNPKKPNRKRLLTCKDLPFIEIKDKLRRFPVIVTTMSTWQQTKTYLSSCTGNKQLNTNNMIDEGYRGIKREIKTGCRILGINICFKLK